MGCLQIHYALGFRGISVHRNTSFSAFTCVSHTFLFLFLIACLFCSIPICVLFYFILFFRYLVFSNKQKECAFWQERRLEESQRSWGKGNHNQNMLYEKTPFLIKIKWSRHNLLISDMTENNYLNPPLFKQKSHYVY